MFPQFKKLSMFPESKGAITSTNTIPMSKPILIVRFPHDAVIQQLEATSNIITNKKIDQDYHVLILHDLFNNEGIKFECFNAPHTEIEFNELKEKVLASIKNK